MISKIHNILAKNIFISFKLIAGDFMINNNFSYNQFSFCGTVDKSVVQRLDNILKRDIESVITNSKERKTKVNPEFIQSLKLRKCAILQLLEKRMQAAHPQTKISIKTSEDKKQISLINLSNPILHTELDVNYKLNTLKDFERMTKDITSAALGIFEKNI